MANLVKFSNVVENGTIKKGNFILGINNNNYGPSYVSDYFNGYDVPDGGYGVYYVDGGGVIRVFASPGDRELMILLKNEFGLTGDTFSEVIPQTFDNPNLMVVNSNYPDIITDGLKIHYDAGFVPSVCENQDKWYDLTGGGSNANLINGPTLKYYNGGLIRTDGIDDYIQFTPSAQTIYQKNSTITLAFDDADMGTVKRLISASSVFGIIWKRESDTEHYIRINNITDPIVNLGEIPEGLKYLTITIDENYLSKFYINGELRHTQSFSGGSIDQPYNNFNLGVNINNYESFERFDYYGFSLYDRVLSDDEVRQNFDAFYERFKFKILIDTEQVGITNNNQFQLPIFGDVNNNFTVEWGDGTVSTGLTGTTLHTYDTPGQYEIKTYGKFDRILFNYVNYYERAADSLKLLEVRNWGDIKWSSMRESFTLCSNLQVYTHSIPNLENCTDMYRTFFRGSGTCLKNSKSLYKWDVSNITNMSGLFFGNYQFQTDLSQWDVSSVTNMSALFQESNYNQDISSWDVSNVTNMFRMFWYNRQFNQPIGSWDTSSVVSMREMFESPTSEFNQDISNWIITGVTDFTEFMVNTTLDTVYYDDILVSWEAQGPNQNITIDFGTSQYTPNSAASTARQSLIDNYNWTIIDGGRVLDEDYSNLLTYATDNGITLPSSEQIDAQDDLIRSLKEYEIWDRIDVFYVFATDSEEFALLNWKSPGNHIATKINSPVFISNVGFRGDGTDAYISTNFNPLSNGINYTLNNASRFYYLNNRYSGLWLDASGDNRNSTGWFVSNCCNRINSDYNSTPYDIKSLGFKQIVRNSSQYYYIFNEKVQSPQLNTPSTSIRNGTQNIMGNSYNVSDSEFSMYGMGGSLIEQNNDFVDIFNEYLSKL